MNELVKKTRVQFGKMINMSDEEMNKTIEGFRAFRAANKITENKSKPPLNSPDILEADDFTFEPFEQKRGEDGDSGDLLLAVRKSDKSEKYIVKHAYCDCAANEFVYSKMAQAMELRVPEVKLFRLSDPLDNTLFKTEYVAGIKYLNIIDENPDFGALIRARNYDDYYMFFGLHKLFLEHDLPHIVLADDNYLYRIDCTDAFAINEIMFMCAGVDTDEDKNGDTVKSSASADNRGFKKHWNIYDIDRAMEHYCLEFGWKEMIMLIEPFRAVRFVRKPYIDKFLNTLCYFYPDCVGEYYSGLFAEMKKAMRKIAPFLTEKYI